MEIRQASIYDFPAYYDAVFGSDTAAELRFLEACFRRHVPHRVRRIYEPACGTGRLLAKLSRAGYGIGGIDLNRRAVDYCNARLERIGARGRVDWGDMSDFKVRRAFDAGFNTINSFRHLATEADALGHLRSMAGAIRPGGIYILGLHLTPIRGTTTDTECWSARRGQLTINTSMWAVDKDRRKRIERFAIVFDIYKPTEQFRIEDELVLRSYTLKQFQELIAAVPEWDWVDSYDFSYNIENPLQPDGETEDLVAILKRSDFGRTV